MQASVMGGMMFPSLEGMRSTSHVLPIRTMPLDLWRKDLRIIGDFANALCCPTPLFSASVTLFNAAVASGFRDQDKAVCTVMEALAGLGTPMRQRAGEVLSEP